MLSHKTPVKALYMVAVCSGQVAFSSFSPAFNIQHPEHVMASDQKTPEDKVDFLGKTCLSSQPSVAGWKTATNSHFELRP